MLRFYYIVTLIMMLGCFSSVPVFCSNQDASGPFNEEKSLDKKRSPILSFFKPSKKTSKKSPVSRQRSASDSLQAKTKSEKISSSEEKMTEKTGDSPTFTGDSSEATLDYWDGEKNSISNDSPCISPNIRPRTKSEPAWIESSILKRHGIVQDPPEVLKNWQLKILLNATYNSSRASTEAVKIGEGVLASVKMPSSFFENIKLLIHYVSIEDMFSPEKKMPIMQESSITVHPNLEAQFIGFLQARYEGNTVRNLKEKNNLAAGTLAQYVLVLKGNFLQFKQKKHTSLMDNKLEDALLYLSITRD